VGWLSSQRAAAVLTDAGAAIFTESGASTTAFPLFQLQAVHRNLQLLMVDLNEKVVVVHFLALERSSGARSMG